MLTSIPLTPLETGGTEQQQPSSGASGTPRLVPGSLKVGDRVLFVRWAASEGDRETELVVSLISKAHVYCDDLQTGKIQVFNRQHHHVTGLGWLKSVAESAAEPLLLHGHSYPPCPLADVLEAEARQGRTVAVAIEHDGGWAVSSGNQHEHGGQDDDNRTDS